MPPKKKGAAGGKGGKKKSEGYVIDGVSTTEMTREQLEEFAHRLKSEMEREREERNYFQIERDNMRIYWDITRQHLIESRAQLRNKDREIEEAEEKHQTEIKLYQQKVKHLLYEHQNNLSELKAESMVSLKMAQDDYNEQEMELLKDKRELKSQLKEQEVTHQDEVRTIQMNHSEEISKLRETFEVEAREIEAKFEKRLAVQRAELSLRHRMELTEVEERKNNQIAELRSNHEKAFAEIKNYYNDITLNNLALINSLKATENHKLVEPLKQAQIEVAELNRRMKNYEKDKMSLANTKTRLGICQKEFDELKWENEVLELRFEKLQQERDDLHSGFVNAILELQQKTGLKNVLLEKKLAALNDLLEQKEAQINEVLVAAHLDPSAMATVNKKLEVLYVLHYKATSAILYTGW
ncbi:Growth arrest-specific protein 8 [Blattella germanica]|nr:Growth arrest-specific protein 8 [Blattella germanica]